MRLSSWLIPLGAAASIAAMFWMAPAYDAYARLYQPKLTRQEAIAAVRELTRQYGTDTSRWSWALEKEVRGQQNDALMRFPRSPVLRSLSPFSLRVLATSPSGDTILVTLSPGGRPTSYQHRRTSEPRRGPVAAPPAGLLQRELERYAGANGGMFHLTTAGVSSQEGLRTVWEWPDPDQPGVLARFEVVTLGGVVVRAAYTTEIAFRLMVRQRRAQQMLTGTLVGAIIVIGSLLAFLAIWNFFSRITVRVDHIRFGVALCAVGGASILAGWLSGDITNAAAFAQLTASGGLLTLLLGTATFGALNVLGVALVLASGYALLSEQAKPRWIGLRLLSRRDLFASAVGREIALGLLGGIAVAGLFYLPAAIPALTVERVELTAPSFLVDPVPSIAPLAGLTTGVDLIALFGFFLPWLQTRAWRRGISYGLFAVVGVITLAAVRQPFSHDLAPNLLACALALAALSAIYRGAGILGIWFAAVGILAANQAAIQFVCGTPAYIAQGRVTAGLWSAVLLAAGLIWRFGTRFEPLSVIASMAPTGKAISRSDRERLLGEFTVARRAQEGMLPGAPPEIPHYSLAAACEPANEVGGDLYDFIAFPGGQWGLCVADVAGKGVPAALYMTLTKGMLVAAGARPADLPLIASRMNRFLEEAGRRRTFVTMSLGVLDGQRGVFRHIRAGHNPPLLYTARDRQCRYLMPKGIGLGITAGATFERTLEVEEVQLAPKDVLVLYSDGLTECMNPARQLYGEERLREIVVRNAHLNALGIQDAILTDSRLFRGSADAHDDLTVVVLRAEARDSLR